MPLKYYLTSHVLIVFIFKVIISVISLCIVAISLHYHIRGAFCLGILFGTIAWWAYADDFPSRIVSVPILQAYMDRPIEPNWSSIILLSIELTFLYVMTLNGLMRSLSDLGNLTKPDGAVPGGRWLYIICGLTTIVSGILGATPVLISPESAAGIKAGAKSGLSTCICGVLFGLSAFFGPLFAAVPAAGTAPLLLMIGVLLFQNVQRIPWSESRLAVPAFCCLFFIPLTYNLSHGIYIAIFLYISIGIFTTDFWITALKFCDNYYFEIRNAFAAFNSKGDFILTTSTARDEDSFRLSSCLNNRNVEERESRFNSDTTNSKAKATFDGIENPNHSTSSTIMSQNFDGKETDAVTEANSEKHEGQIPALHNRARIATVVLRGGSKFDMRLPQQRYHSSLLFLEGNDGDDALQRYLDLEEPQASLQASAFNISRNRSRTS